MGKYPYRIQYFVCKEFAENEKNVPGLLKALQELDSFTGEVTGETCIDGLRLDFNCGLRLIVPEGDFHVRIGDYDSEEIFLSRMYQRSALYHGRNITSAGRWRYFLMESLCWRMYLIPIFNVCILTAAMPRWEIFWRFFRI